MAGLFRTLKIRLRESMSKNQVSRTSRPEGSFPLQADKVPFYLNDLEENFGPVYRHTCEFLSPRIRKAGAVLDMGGGAGTFALHLAQARKDIRVQCLLPNLILLNGAREVAKKKGLANIQFIKDEPKNLILSSSDKTVAVTMVLSLSNFSTEKDLRTCLQNIRNVYDRFKSQLFMFDFCRPNHPTTITDTMKIFSENPSANLRKEILSQLEGTWNYTEMFRMLDFIEFPQLGHWPGQKIPLFQAHTNLNKLYTQDHKAGWGPAIFSRKQIDIYERLSSFMPF